MNGSGLIAIGFLGGRGDDSVQKNPTGWRYSKSHESQPIMGGGKWGLAVGNSVLGQRYDSRKATILGH